MLSLDTRWIVLRLQELTAQRGFLTSRGGGTWLLLVLDGKINGSGNHTSLRQNRALSQGKACRKHSDRHSPVYCLKGNRVFSPLLLFAGGTFPLIALNCQELPVHALLGGCFWRRGGGASGGGDDLSEPGFGVNDGGC